LGSPIRTSSNGLRQHEPEAAAAAYERELQGAVLDLVGQFEAGWHAGELETSMILALDARLVRMEQAAPGFIGDLMPLRDKLMREGVKAIAPTGVLGDPRLATREHGEAYVDALSDSVTRFFRGEVERRRTGEAKAGRASAG